MTKKKPTAKKTVRKSSHKKTQTKKPTQQKKTVSKKAHPKTDRGTVVCIDIPELSNAQVKKSPIIKDLSEAVEKVFNDYGIDVAVRFSEKRITLDLLD